MNTVAMAILAVSAWIATRRKKARQVEDDSGWDDNEGTPPDDVEYDDRDPCFLDPDPERRKLPPDSAVALLPGAEGSEQFCANPNDVEPAKALDVPWAVGSPTPRWPVVTRHPRRYKVNYKDVRGKYHGVWGNVFGATRKNKKTGAERYHVGVDLAGYDGDEVVAIESGTIARVQSFTDGTWAVLEETDSGIVVLYGEIGPRSWVKYVSVGDRVEAGQPIATIQKMCGALGCKEMLHLETYTKGTRENVSWFKKKPAETKSWYHWGDTPPPQLLNPSRYLLLASILERNRVA